MKRYRPLLASLIVIAVAMAALATWRMTSEPSKPRFKADNRPATNAPPGDNSGIEYKTALLESLPELDPLGLWPRDGQAVPAPQFWVTWETTEFSRCRLLVTRNRLDWHDLGSTGGTVHYLAVNLGDFDSRATFAVEFETRGKRYRSKPRTVSFARGIAFAQREISLTISDEPLATQLVSMIGDTSALSQDSFRSYWFPDDVQPFVLPVGGEVRFGVGAPSAIPAAGCIGFVEVFDLASVTSDRVLVKLRR